MSKPKFKVGDKVTTDNPYRISYIPTGILTIKSITDLKVRNERRRFSYKFEEFEHRELNEIWLRKLTPLEEAML